MNASSPQPSPHRPVSPLLPSSSGSFIARARTERVPFGAPEILVLALAAAALGAFLWTGSLVNSDDAIYASMARDATRTGDWLDFSWQGTVLHEKPPMLFWLVGLSGRLLGFSDLAVRLPGALCGFGVLVLVLALGRRFGLGRAGTILAMLATLASGCFYFNARRVMTDAPLVFFGLLSLYFWLRARQDGRWFMAWGAAVGMAILTKWVAAGPFVLLCATDLLVPRLRRGVHWGWLAAGVLVIGAVAAPWHVVQTLRHGGEFWQVYLGYHVLGRMSSELVGTVDVAYYLRGTWLRESLLLALWTAGGVALAIRLVRRGPGDDVARWLFVWLLVTLVPIHLAGTKIYHYLLPAIPALALTAAMAAEPFLANRVVTAALVALALAAFALNNGGDLMTPDYAPGSKALAPSMAAVPRDGVVAVVDEYDVAATWYADRPIPLWTTLPSLYKQWSVDMMRRAGAVRLLTEGELDAELGRGSRAALLTGLAGREVLQRRLQDAGRPYRQEAAGGRYLFVVDGVGKTPAPTPP